MNGNLPVKPRPVSRVVLVSPQTRVLMFDSELAYTRVWLCPGGGLDPGENFMDGARRELEEETGLRDLELRGPIWSLRFRFEFEGVIYDQDERYFLARSGSEEIATEAWTETEAKEIQRFRWWSIEEIADSADDFRPAEFAKLLPAVAQPKPGDGNGRGIGRAGRPNRLDGYPIIGGASGEELQAGRPSANRLHAARALYSPPEAAESA